MKFLQSFTFPFDYNNIRKRGIRFNGKYGYGFILLNASDSRICISISKKKLSLAVDRNLMRRRIRNAFISCSREMGINYHLFYTYNFSDILPYNKILNEVTFILQNCR